MVSILQQLEGRARRPWLRFWRTFRNGDVLRALGHTLRLKAVRSAVALPALVLAVYLPVLVLHTIATSQMQHLDQVRIEVRDFGDPSRALTRIRESSITTTEHLDELAANPDVSPPMRQVFANAPLLVKTPDMFSGRDNTLIGLYYTLAIDQFQSTSITTIHYFVYFTDEAAGTPLPIRMARYGQPFDGELLFRLSLINDRVLSADYQAPIHQILPFDYVAGQRPTFAIASPNHNFRLARPGEGPTVALLPQSEIASDPFHDPDFVALAAQEALVQHGIDISHYVYVAFQNPAPNVPVDVSVRVHGNWYHLHDMIADGDVLGGSITVEGYHQVAIRVGFTPRPEDIDEVRIIARTHDPVELAVFALYVYPEPAVTI